MKASTSRRYETTILQLAAHLETYADCHRELYETGICDDSVLGPPWEDMCESLLSLLNGETGNLDCGRMDGKIRRLMREHGSDRDSAGRSARYRVIRAFADHGATASREIATGLTIEQAQAHCKDPETSSTTCTSPEGQSLTLEMGPWFDSYELE